MLVELTSYNYAVAMVVLEGKATVPDIVSATGLATEAVRDQVAALRKRGVLQSARRRPHPSGGRGGGHAVYVVAPGVQFNKLPAVSKRWVAVAHVPAVTHV